MGCPEWKNSIPTLGGIWKTLLTFGRHVLVHPQLGLHPARVPGDPPEGAFEAPAPVTVTGVHIAGQGAGVPR